MVTQQEANQIVMQYLQARMPRYASDIVILDELTLEKPYGWVFFYDHRRHLETKKLRDALVGNSPVLVEKSTGRIFKLGTAAPIEFYLKQYEDGSRQPEAIILQKRE